MCLNFTFSRLCELLPSQPRPQGHPFFKGKALGTRLIAVRHSSVGTLPSNNGDVHETFGNYLKSPSRLKRREFRLALRRVQAEMVEFIHLAVPVLK